MVLDWADPVGDPGGPCLEALASLDLLGHLEEAFQEGAYGPGCPGVVPSSYEGHLDGDHVDHEDHEVHGDLADDDQSWEWEQAASWIVIQTGSMLV